MKYSPCPRTHSWHLPAPLSRFHPLTPGSTSAGMIAYLVADTRPASLRDLGPGSLCPYQVRVPALMPLPSQWATYFRHPSESLRCHAFPPHSSTSSAHQNQLLCQHATPGLCLWVPENTKPKVPRQELYNRVKRHSCCTPGRSAALEEEASDPSKPQCGGRPATPFHPASHLALSSVTSEPVQRMFRDYTGV